MKNIIITVIAVFFGLTTFAQKSINNKSWTEKLNEEYCTGVFQTTDGTILDVASNPSVSSYLNILDWMSGRVAGLTVRSGKNGVSIPLIRGRVPGIFVDEQQVSANYLNTLPVHDIAMAKVIKTPFYGGINSGGGAIAIYTRGGEEEEEPDEME
jgi:hypothetical protein